MINITTKSASLRQHFKHASVCETKDDSVYVNRLLCVSGCACACVWACSVASLLLQQGGDVDVPANGLSVEATCEQVARLVLFVPRRTAHHSPVTHSVAAWQPGQPHAAHVEQTDLSVVVWQRDDPLVGRDADPVHSGVSADGCYRRPHVLQIPHLDGAIVAP